MIRIAIVLLPIALLCGCASTRQAPAGHVASNVQAALDDVKDASVRAAIANVRAQIAVTQQERDAAKREALEQTARADAERAQFELEQAAEKRAAREAEDREARASFVRNASLFLLAACLAGAGAYAYPLLRWFLAPLSGGLAVYVVAALAIRSLLAYMGYVGASAAAVAVFAIFRHGLSNQAVSLGVAAKTEAVALEGKAAAVVAKLRARFAKTAAPTPTPVGERPTLPPPATP
jgi:hypothetical protein